MAETETSSDQFVYLVEVAGGKERRFSEPPPPPRIFGEKGLVSRETIEQLSMAVVLAFLFRAFLAEAFIIPTGSMAPTLMGRHVDLVCPQCGYRYEAGASGEEPQDPNSLPESPVATVCQNCRYFYRLDPRQDKAHRSYSGDRILVSKLSYEFREPKRWDVIVFKFPDDAKQNYIKRLIGLPGEWITIFAGDIYTGKTPDGPSQIARKPPDKIEAMLQLVYDTKYTPAALYRAGFPHRWQGVGEAGKAWQASRDGRVYTLKKPTPKTAWLYYRHIVPTSSDWKAVADARHVPRIDRKPYLITDFYAYNAFKKEPMANIASGTYRPSSIDPSYGDDLAHGRHLVGDLAMTVEIELLGDEGEIVLELIESGRHHTCRVDVATGLATLTLDDGRLPFGEGEKGPKRVTAQTGVRGAGLYRLRLANVDSQLVLWVNGRVVSFDGPTTYDVDPFDELPSWSPDEPGDFAPARLGLRGVAATVHRLQLHRDIYYIADTRNQYLGEYEGRLTYEDVMDALRNPEAWDRVDLFRRRPWVRFELGPDQFFPLGDNSPQSYDARSWLGGHVVPRRLLTGKALAVFWPHPIWIHVPTPVPWLRGIPLPNVPQMQWIR